MRSKRAQVGDICEIKTPAGLAYIQFTHDADKMGQLVRVLPGLFEARPQEFSDLAERHELYFVFYTLKYALRDREAEVVSHQSVPLWARPYPLMRWPGARDASGKVITWKIFKASDPLTLEAHRKTQILFQLTPEQQGLSIHTLWPHPVMVRELARGWTPERAEEMRLKDLSEAAQRNGKARFADAQSEDVIRHFLYFEKKRDAEHARERLVNLGFSVRVRKGADPRGWLALAQKAPPQSSDELEEVRDKLESLAVQFGGEYDGWEAAVEPFNFEGLEDTPKIN